jgi:AmmeMemoRadiSam system protein A
MSERLSESEREIAITLARNAIREYLTSRVYISYPNHPFLQAEAAAFVTLKLGPDLRGCIGVTQPKYSLGEAIVRCAISAGFDDARFTPLTWEEFEQIRLEISILSEFQRIYEVQEIEPGTHGIMISIGHYRGLLLPQVATDHNWDRETFFKHVCHKAGLSTQVSPWNPSVKVEVFTAEVFGEEHTSREHVS